MYIAILGRQPEFGVAELEQICGASAVSWFSNNTAMVDVSDLDFNKLGGSQKAGRVVAELNGNWRNVSMQLVKAYASAWSERTGKITLGISVYGFPVESRDVQKTGIVLKKKLREHNVSLRLIPNASPTLNTATSHHNKLGLSDNHVELLIVKSGSGKVVVAESIGAQNITAFAGRDQARPKTDAFVGMLPPKLARIMVNLSGVKSGRLLDPFCGTGVVLQEALLLGFDAYGTDLAQKMVDYSNVNLKWLSEKYNLNHKITLDQGDAMDYKWQKPVDVVVAETYLGQPFSAPPSPAKLVEVRGNCNHIISKFLSNLSSQIDVGTTVCIAIPAWRDKNGNFTLLPVTGQVNRFGFERVSLKNITTDQLLYYRESQVVAREILILKKVLTKPQ